MSSRCGVPDANAARAASSTQTDKVAYCFLRGRARRENPTTPSEPSSCFRTALAPRNRRRVEEKRRGGILEASTMYLRPGSSGCIDFHGDFTRFLSVRDGVYRVHRQLPSGSWPVKPEGLSSVRSCAVVGYIRADNLRPTPRVRSSHIPGSRCCTPVAMLIHAPVRARLQYSDLVGGWHRQRRSPSLGRRSEGPASPRRSRPERGGPPAAAR